MPISKSKQQAAVAGTPDDIEQLFYEALQSADIERLMHCFAQDEEIICTMPSGIRIMGLSAVREAFSTIFEGGPINVSVRDIVKSEAMYAAVHSVMQHILLRSDDGQMEVYLSATNVYHKTPHGWRMVAHHSSPAITEEAVNQVEVRPTVLH